MKGNERIDRQKRKEVIGKGVIERKERIEKRSLFIQKMLQIIASVVFCSTPPGRSNAQKIMISIESGFC